MPPRTEIWNRICQGKRPGLGSLDTRERQPNRVATEGPAHFALQHGGPVVLLAELAAEPSHWSLQFCKAEDRQQHAGAAQAPGRGHTGRCSLSRGGPLHLCATNQAHLFYWPRPCPYFLASSQGIRAFCPSLGSHVYKPSLAHQKPKRVPGL